MRSSSRIQRGTALFGLCRAPFEVFDFGHVGGDTTSVFAFARAIAALRLGGVVVLRHVMLLCGVAEKVDRRVYQPAPPSEIHDRPFERVY